MDPDHLPSGLAACDAAILGSCPHCSIPLDPSAGYELEIPVGPRRIGAPTPTAPSERTDA